MRLDSAFIWNLMISSSLPAPQVWLSSWLTPSHWTLWRKCSWKTPQSNGPWQFSSGNTSYTTLRKHRRILSRVWQDTACSITFSISKIDTMGTSSLTHKDTWSTLTLDSCFRTLLEASTLSKLPSKWRRNTWIWWEEWKVKCLSTSRVCSPKASLKSESTWMTS